MVVCVGAIVVVRFASDIWIVVVICSGTMVLILSWSLVPSSSFASDICHLLVIIFIVVSSLPSNRWTSLTHRGACAQRSQCIRAWVCVRFLTICSVCVHNVVARMHSAVCASVHAYVCVCEFPQHLLHARSQCWGV